MRATAAAEERREKSSERRHGPQRPPVPSAPPAPTPEQAHAAKALLEVQAELAASKAAEKAAEEQLRLKQAEIAKLTAESEAAGELKQVLAQLEQTGY